MPSGKSKYPVLSQDCTLRLLEVPYVFNASHDQLYEIDQEALDFLLKCNGISHLIDLIEDLDDPGIMKFIDYMIEEGIL